MVLPIVVCIYVKRLANTKFPFSFTDSDIENDLEISLDMRNLQLFLLGLANMSEKSLMGFPIRGKCGAVLFVV